MAINDTQPPSDDPLGAVELPSRIERKITNTGDDAWYEYDGEPLFDTDTLDHLRRRFREMNEYAYESIASVKGSSGRRTKIRSSDLDAFIEDLTERKKRWVDSHGPRLTAFENQRYGEPITEFGVVEITEEAPRRTDLSAQYQAGYRAFIGGPDGKRQAVLLPIRTYEQWSYHTEVVDPLFDEYHEKYPY
jgi:hypothetical protein